MTASAGLLFYSASSGVGYSFELCCTSPQIMVFLRLCVPFLARYLRVSEAVSKGAVFAVIAIERCQKTSILALVCALSVCRPCGLCNLVFVRFLPAAVVSCFRTQHFLVLVGTLLDLCGYVQPLDPCVAQSWRTPEPREASFFSQIFSAYGSIYRIC